LYSTPLDNGYVLNGYFSGRERPIVFKRADKRLADNPITNGRNQSERVNAVATFSGSAFQAGEEFLPGISVAGWYQGAVAEFGKGKVAFFSEAAMFTAQIFDQGRMRVGMNHPLAKDNAQLLLNVMHWLSDLH